MEYNAFFIIGIWVLLFGKVLVGIQDSSNNKELLKRYLKRTGYTFTEETSNIAYKHFLE